MFECEYVQSPQSTANFGTTEDHTFVPPPDKTPKLEDEGQKDEIQEIQKENQDEPPKSKSTTKRTTRSQTGRSPAKKQSTKKRQAPQTNKKATGKRKNRPISTIDARSLLENEAEV